MRFDDSGWVVRLSRPDVIKQLFSNTELFPKDDFKDEFHGTVFGRFAASASNLIFSRSTQQWKAQRMVANPAFKRAAPVETFGRLTQTLFDVMDRDVSKPIEFHDMMERWTLDAIGLGGFGFDFRAVVDRESDWVQKYNRIIKAMLNPLYLVLPVLDQKLLFLQPGRQRIHNELTELLNMLRGLIIQKRQEINEKKKFNIADNEKDVLTLMIEAENEGNGTISDDELLSNLCIFFIAGHETSANALSYAAYYLAVNPDIQNKAREEATRLLGTNSEDILPTLQQCRNMPYLNAIIKETLRISPPVINVVARAATHDTELGGLFIPKGTRFSVDVYEMQHNPTVWKDPEVFRPERFLPGGEAEENSKLGLPWVPFGSGARQCIGMNYALDEQRVLLSMLLRKYTWSLPEDSIHKDKLKSSGLIVMSVKDLYLYFQRLY
ncbi:cytochrome P450 [Fennellomyces sp. T-0311]|nr:cytochrome P450 [Fennellomyces sp. T-0311]